MSKQTGENSKPFKALWRVIFGLFFCFHLNTVAYAQSPDVLEQGKSAYHQGQYVTAIEYLLMALQSSQDTETYSYLGLAYYQLGTYTLAADAFESARTLSAMPSPSLLYSLAMSYYYAREYAQAQEFLNQVLQLPTTPADLKTQAEEQLLLALRDQSSAYQLAMQAYQAGQDLEAIQAFQEVLVLVPNSAEIHYYLGLSAYRHLDFDLARRSFQAVIRLSPQSEYANSAQQTLEVIQKLEPELLPSRPFYGSLTTGLLGDSNVNFGGVANSRSNQNNDQTPSPILNQSALQDLGSTLNLNLNYSLNAVSSLNYNYFWNLYLGLNDRPDQLINSYDQNFQQHSLAMNHRVPVLDWLELAITTRTNTQILAGDAYLLNSEVRPMLTFYETERLISRLYLELGSEKYFRFSARDNVNYALGLEQFVYLWNSDTWLNLYYRFQHILAQDTITSQLSPQPGYIFQVERRSAFSRSDNQLGLGLHFPIAVLQCEIGTSFNFLLYNQPDLYRESRIFNNPLTGLPLPPFVTREAQKHREDTRLNFYMQALWPIWDQLKLVARYQRLTNISNIPPQEFNASNGYLVDFSYLKDTLDLSLRWEF